MWTIWTILYNSSCISSAIPNLERWAHLCETLTLTYLTYYFRCHHKDHKTKFPLLSEWWRKYNIYIIEDSHGATTAAVVCHLPQFPFVYCFSELDYYPTNFGQYLCLLGEGAWISWFGKRKRSLVNCFLLMQQRILKKNSLQKSISSMFVENKNIFIPYK